MVDSSSGSGIDRLEINEGAVGGVVEKGGARGTRDDSQLFQFQENSRWGTKSSMPRESGLIVRLFPSPPQIFGSAQVKQSVGRDNERCRDSPDSVNESELRPLEAEALSLSRMLKSLQPQEFPGFPTSGLPAELDSPTGSLGSMSSRRSVESCDVVGGEIFGAADEPTNARSPRSVRLGVRDRNDGLHPFSAGSYANNSLFSPSKSPKSRRTPGSFTYSSKGSSPASSVGSASELQFSTVLQSPPSPEPLRPGSPLKWRSRTSTVSPVEDPPVRHGISDTPVQRLVGRNPSFSEYINPGAVSGKMLFDDGRKKSAHTSQEGPREHPEHSEVVQKLKEAGYQHMGDDEIVALHPGLPDLDEDRLDYSFALEYQGPPIVHGVPTVHPLDLSSVDGIALPSPVIRGSPSSPRRMASVPSLEMDIASRIFSTSSRVPETDSDPGSSISCSPRLKKDSKHRTEHLDRPASPFDNSPSGTEQDEADVRATRSSRGDAIRQASFRSEGSWDYDSDVACKGYSLSLAHSYRGVVPETLTPSKSEPGGLFKMQTTAHSAEDPDNYAYHGQRPRSMSLPGIEPLPVEDIHQSSSSPLSASNYDYFGVPPVQQRRKGECYSCRKGHWLTEKESCLVCNSKFCYNCVLMVMESMPEGRKCKTCIGKPVYDARRASIGKPSRLLNRLLSPQEVQQIMKAEKECAANQLRPEQLYVNGKQLTADELAILLGCPNPPQKLKPGKYWYDSQSGLWGKDGERPDKLITHDLKVGGLLQSGASNGTTQVFMNNRELGKLECKMLKLAGVHCPPTTHLWVEADGSYQEEGQKTSKGNIWKKTSIRLLYPFFSLPTPGGNSRSTKDDQRDGPEVYVPDYLTQNKLHKLLLLGHEGSGRSTIFKQTKFLFKEGFTPEERQKMKSLIQCNIYRYISILLEGRERFEEEDDDLVNYGAGEHPGEMTGSRKSIYALDARLKQQADWFSEGMVDGSLETCLPATSHEYAPLLNELWKDPALKATFQRKDELNALPDFADYFLDKVMDFSNNEYSASDLDILRAEGLAQGTGLAEVVFSLDNKLPSCPDIESPSPGRYQLIKVGGKGLAEGCKWLDMLEDVHAVIFCVAISEYDQMTTDVDGTVRSKLRQTELFESVLKHPVLREKPFVLLLNKYDLFEAKFCKGIPLTTCEWFTDFRPVGASQMSPQIQAQQAYTYVVHKYKELFANCGHKLFTFKLNATEHEKVLEAFQYVTEILKWKDNGWECFQEESSYSTDLSSYSQQVFSTG